MTVTPDRPGPYAPGSVIIDLIERHRNKGLPAPVNADVLARAGVSDSLIQRTVQALQTLDLIDENGAPTQIFEGLRLAPEADYKGRVAEWLRGTYADALQYVDPATDGETAIRDAFRQYNPVGQQPRMVTLFAVLFRYAGIGPEKTTPTPRKRVGLTKVVRPIPAGAFARPAPRDSGGGRNTGSHHQQSGAFPPAIAGVLATLPVTGTWTKADRDAFVKAFEAVLDFSIKIVARVDQPQSNEGADHATV